MSAEIAVIIPVLQDDEALESLLATLGQLLCCEPPGFRCARRADTASGAATPLRAEIMVVDGAGQASTQALVRDRASYLVRSPSRGGQIMAGIDHTEAPWIWVLHADTQLNSKVINAITGVVRGDQPRWGRFDVMLPGLAVIAWFMNQRSRLTRICTGDQAMFFARSLLASGGGFPDQPLMEDIEISRRLKRISGRAAFVAVPVTVGASARRWRNNGVVRTVLNMWGMRLRYFAGAPPQRLYQRYYTPGARH